MKVGESAVSGSGRGTASNGEPSLNGSLNKPPNEGQAVSEPDSKSPKQQSQNLTKQSKNSSSTASKTECTKRRLSESRQESDEPLDKQEEWVDVLGNGDLMMRTLHKGTENIRPDTGELVRIMLKNLTAPGSAQPEELRFVLGYGFSFDALDMSISLMSLGGVAHIKSHPRFVDSSAGESFCEYEIQLLDVKPASSLDLNVRVNEAREAGNKNYNRGRYENACRLYDYGVGLLNDAKDLEDEVENLESRRYTLISNWTACLTKLKEWQKAVEMTDRLVLGPNVEVDKLILTKLMLRRSDALMHLKRYNDAIDSLRACLSVDPSNTLAKSLLQQTKIESAKEEKRMKNVYKNMLKALGRDETGRPGSSNNVKSFLFSNKFFLLASLVGVVSVVIYLISLYY